MKTINNSQLTIHKTKESIVKGKLPTVRERGFTFIELLAVIAVLLAVSIIVGAILYTALRGTNKTNTITTVRQNGNYALSQMAKMIREARSFDGVSIDDTAYTVNCLQPTPMPGNPSPTPVPYKYIRITSFDDKKTTFACCSQIGQTPPAIASSSASPSCSMNPSNTPLIDTRAVSFSASTCSFTCTQASAVNVPEIQIHFELTGYSANPTILPEKTASASAIPFDTSVTFRNLIR